MTVLTNQYATVALTVQGMPQVLEFQIMSPGPTGGVGPVGPTGPAGPAGVVAATAPLSYNAGTQTLSIDLSAYETASHAAATYYPVTNPAGYITSADLTGYATEAWVDAQGYLQAGALSGYALQSWVTAQGYITSSALTGYLLASTAAATYYPLSNPSGYITSSALSGYALQSWVTAQGYLTSASLSGYATQSWVTSQAYLTSSALTPYLTISSAAATYAVIAAAVPTGGSTGQVLTKSSGSNYALSWTTPAVGDKYYTTSTTSLSISNGTKNITVSTGLSYTTQQAVIVAYDATHHMHGVVTSYNPSTGALVVDVAQHTGTGTYSSWTVNVGGISSVAEWGLITGTLSSQTDLQTALNAKLTDAPNDGTPYVRKNGAWEQLVIS